MLGGNIGIGDGAFPEAGVLEEGSEAGVILVGTGGELFGAFFVGFFPDLPYLFTRRMVSWPAPMSSPDS